MRHRAARLKYTHRTFEFLELTERFEEGGMTVRGWTTLQFKTKAQQRGGSTNAEVRTLPLVPFRAIKGVGRFERWDWHALCMPHAET